MFAYRPLRPDNAPAWKALFLAGASAFPQGFLMTATEVAALDLARCREILGAAGLRGVFAGPRLAGFCGYRPLLSARTRHRAQLGPFFIRAELHGKGAAQEMLAGVIAEAKATGIRQIELGVVAGNHRAIAFYEKHGFTRYGTHPDAMDHADEHLYRLVIRG